MSEGKKQGKNESESESSVSSEEDDDLVLEGVVVRNPDVLSSSDSDDDDDDDGDSDDGKKISATGSKRKVASSSKELKRNIVMKKKKKDDDEVLQVDFTFCDMGEVYFHGLKSLLNNSSSIYQEHSSSLSDSMIENISVGTVVSTTLEDRQEGNVFAFASVLNCKTYEKSPAIQFLTRTALDKCPSAHSNELKVVLSGKTARPAGFLLHGRMVNLPLEVVLTLHQQLVLDIDWAVEHAEGGQVERKSLDFGAFVRFAPCQISNAVGNNKTLVYKFFDDEVLADHAEFSFSIDAPKTYSNEDKMSVNIIVLTKTGHRAALAGMSKLIHGK